ncbi:hypothetical protein N7490_000743 [Penicillium lividum]|nr:hypothetical protein N7490_000743 [Penicillium lividum]
MAPLGTPVTTLSNSKSESTKGFIRVFTLQPENPPAAASKDANVPKPTLTEVAISSVEVVYDEVNQYRESTQLGMLREALKPIIIPGHTYKFCIDDGSVVAETVSLASYRNMLHRKADDAADGVQRVYIVPSNDPEATQAATLLQPPFLLKFIQMGEKANDALNTGSLHSDTFKGRDPSGMALAELRKLIPKMSKNIQIHTFCSLDRSAAADELSLSKYLELDGDSVKDKGATPSIIIRYRKTDAKVSAAESKFHGASPEVLAAMERLKPQLGFTERSAEELKMDTTALEVKEELQASQFAARDANPRKFTSLMDEADWDAVLRNCCLLYGWRVNQTTRQIERATTPAFRLRDKASLLPVIAAVPPPLPAQVSTPASESSTTPDTAPVGSVSSTTVVPESQPLQAADVHTPMPVKLGAIPSYSINDQSRIEVVNVTSNFQESMAKNHFSASSIEASASGGWGGFSVGITGGASEESSSGATTASKQVSKKMIASYKFPRVTVFLRPEDLEPTEELQKALDRVKKSKNINDLRKIQSTFGQLFCSWATVGGCLQTSKMVTGTENSLQTSEKEKFKAQVGIAVSTPFGANAEMKASHETQGSTETSRKESHTNEGMTFEATGGNTLMAADWFSPQTWSGSVADFNNWRVIEQSEPTRMIDAIAEMPGYEHVHSWFLRAVPALSKYLVIPNSRTLHVRFRVAGLPGSSLETIAQTKSQAYLGVDPQKPPMPMRTGMRFTQPESEVHKSIKGTFGALNTADLTTTTRQVDIYTQESLFFPSVTQSPVLMFPQPGSADKPDAVQGTPPIKKDEKELQTVWKLEVAEGHSVGFSLFRSISDFHHVDHKVAYTIQLNAKSLVCIKSCAPVDLGGVTATSPELMLSVYRNAQGSFQPTLMSSDERCYWRLQRVSTEPTADQESFRSGEEVRLTWALEDQSAGFRDYCDDLYGRRQFTWPASVGSSVLALKVPYPRFEPLNFPTISLIMSSVLSKDPVLQPLEIRALANEAKPKVSVYNLHDLTFRLDLVGNEGQGDSKDFMNVVAGASRKETIERISEKTTRVPIQDQSLIPLFAAYFSGQATLGFGRDGVSIMHAMS